MQTAAFLLNDFVDIKKKKMLAGVYKRKAKDELMYPTD